MNQLDLAIVGEVVVLRSFLHKSKRKNRGASTAEYVLCLSLVAITTAGTLNLTSSSLSGTFNRASSEFESSSEEAGRGGGDCENCLIFTPGILGGGPGGLGRGPSEMANSFASEEIVIRGGGSETNSYFRPLLRGEETEEQGELRGGEQGLNGGNFSNGESKEEKVKNSEELLTEEQKPNRDNIPAQLNR